MTALSWIEWNGEGPCPVPEGAGCCLRFRLDSDKTAAATLAARRWVWVSREPEVWRHTGGPADIVGFALEPVAEPQTPSVDWQARLADAWLAGFAASAEGWNGEYPRTRDANVKQREAAADYARRALAQAQEPQP